MAEQPIDEARLRATLGLISELMAERDSQMSQLEISDPEFAEILSVRDQCLVALVAHRTPTGSSQPSAAVERERDRLRMEFEALRKRHENLRTAYRRLEVEVRGDTSVAVSEI